MQRVLVFGMTENPGGVESFLMNYYRLINRDKIQFDFLCNSHNPIAYEDEILSLGGRTFHIIARSKNIVKYKKELEKVFRENSDSWNAIWVNLNSLANIDYLKIALKYGVAKRIVHSHNSQNMDSQLRAVLHEYNKKRINYLATDFWACSMEAAKWFYDDRVIRNVKIIHNAIDVDKYKFSQEKRELIREEYGLGNKFVIGNIGRLHFQKNQSFVIDVFKKYYSRHPESMLILVGQGEDESILKNKANELGLNNKVIFAGVQRDIQAWLSAFDLFLFPSKFEGLSISALEAQANGLMVIASKDVIPKETRICDNFFFFDLNNDAEYWASKTDDLLKNIVRIPYSNVLKNFNNKGYNICNEVGNLENLLLG